MQEHVQLVSLALTLSTSNMMGWLLLKKSIIVEKISGFNTAQSVSSSAGRAGKEGGGGGGGGEEEEEEERR